MKTLLGFALSGLAAVWIGCSSDSSPVSPSASKALTDDGTATATTDPTIDDPLAAIPIPDDSLRAAIVRAVSPTNDATITITRLDLESLTAFSAIDKGIVNLTGLEHATNLDTLNLVGNNIADLNPLAGLDDLVWLNLGNNLIPQTGYSPLANLTKLTGLLIGGHRNADIGSDTLEVVVAGMLDLEYLKVNHMGLTDISFLEKLTKLRNVNLNTNPVDDFEPLTCLDYLERLAVQNTGVAWRFDDAGDVRVSDAHIQYLIDRGDVLIRLDPSRGPVSTW